MTSLLLPPCVRAFQSIGSDARYKFILDRSQVPIAFLDTLIDAIADPQPVRILFDYPQAQSQLAPIVVTRYHIDVVLCRVAANYEYLEIEVHFVPSQRAVLPSSQNPELN